MGTIRAGFIGAGALANMVHYPALAEIDEIDLAAICDLVPEKLRATADRFGVDGRYTDWRAMLAEVDPEVVYVLMPPHQLYDIAVTVLDQGRHLLLEKPPGLTVTQTRNLARKAEQRGCRSIVGFNRRYMPLMRECLRRVTERGPIEQAAVTFHKNYFAGEYYGGAVDILTCDAIHAVDLLRAVGGEPRKVGASVRCTGGESYPTSWNALIEFESGAVGHLMTLWTGGKRFHHAELHAKGISCYTRFEFEAEIWADGGEEPIWSATAAEVAGADTPWRKNGFFGEHRHFVDCIRAGCETESCLADAVRTMELCERIGREQL